MDASLYADHQATQHIVRYQWASRFVAGTRVLDCASGLGYGSAILAQAGASQVVGIEIASEAVEYARLRHGRDNIRFVCADALLLDAQSATSEPSEALGTFDVIVCLETVEHFPDPAALLGVFDRLLADDGVLVLSAPNDAAMGVSNPHHRWHGSFSDLTALLRLRFAAIECGAQVHAVGSAVLPAVMTQSQSSEADQPTPAQPGSVGVIGGVPIEEASGFLFVCHKRAPVSGPRIGGPIACLLPNGFAYVSELESVRDRVWNELQDMRGDRDEKAAAVESALRDARDAGAERDSAAAEARRLSTEWQRVSDELAELRERHNGLYRDTQIIINERDESIAEAQRLAAEWAAVRDRLLAASTARDQIEAEATRLSGEWQTVAGQAQTLRESLAAVTAERDQFAAEVRRLGAEWEQLATEVRGLRGDLGRMTAERDSFSVEARRLSNEWAAMSDELRDYKRRADVAEGDKLILSVQLKSLEERIGRLQSRQQELSRQPLYRVMCRTHLLKSVEVPNESSR